MSSYLLGCTLYLQPFHGVSVSQTDVKLQTVNILAFTFIVDIFRCLRHRLITLIVASFERQGPQTKTQNMFESSAFFIGKIVSYYDDELGCTFISYPHTGQTDFLCSSSLHFMIAMASWQYLRFMHVFNDL
jgi:hypothetical protein